MTRPVSRIGAVVLAAWPTAPALAQETNAWRVFQETGPAECYAVSAPTKQENTRDGEPVQVSRGETRFFVSLRPDQEVEGQVSFTAGYPFADGSMVALDVGSAQFMLFTQGEWAWPANPEEDARVVEALRGGSEAVMTGQSGRGTVTRDTFSLQGFAPAVEEAQTRCAS